MIALQRVVFINLFFVQYRAFYQVSTRAVFDPLYRSYEYATRHFLIASQPQTSPAASLAHRIIGFIECCPFIGRLAGLMDKHIFSYALFNEEQAEIQPMASDDTNFAFPITRPRVVPAPEAPAPVALAPEVLAPEALAPEALAPEALAPEAPARVFAPGGPSLSQRALARARAYVLAHKNLS